MVPRGCVLAGAAQPTYHLAEDPTWGPAVGASSRGVLATRGILSAMFSEV